MHEDRDEAGTEQMSMRKENLLFGIDVAASKGAEIGALHTPTVRKSEGAIYYVDHCSTADLKKKYEHDHSVDIAQIVDVDGIWGEQTLAEALRDFRPLDYVVASHVIEHVPDLVGWLFEVHAVLRDGGKLCLAVPDKRYTFDFLRQLSRLSDLINAYFLKPRTPGPGHLYDHAVNVVGVDVVAAWRGVIDEQRLVHHFDRRGAIGLVRDTLRSGSYTDVHCWVFTPAWFFALASELMELGLFPFVVDRFVDTRENELEFYVTLRSIGAYVEGQTATPEQRSSFPKASAFRRSTIEESMRQNPRADELSGQVRTPEQRALDLERELQRLQNSRSWKMTKPLRDLLHVARLVRGRLAR